MKRMQIGLVALAFIFGALVLWTMGYAVSTMANSVWVMFRVGIVLAALWLAMPQLTAIFSKTPKWLLIALVGAVVVFALQPKLLWWIPVLMLGVWLIYSRFNFGQIISGAGGGKAATRIPRRPKRKA
ncbi:hypothetical protein [Anatilimnocola floriformis]|uniref:hypothetical protein n=1 Tax=Anatilimnocola floriformis TaxID=2948575 RepID=UPI0020C59900|nr:hypothetical protein [Anatilimnocola floriformis]